MFALQHPQKDLIIANLGQSMGRPSLYKDVDQSLKREADIAEKKPSKKQKKGGAGVLRGPPAEMKTHDVVRNEGMTLFKSVEQQLFTSAAPSYVNFLYQKEQAAQAAKNADKPKKKG